MNYGIVKISGLIHVFYFLARAMFYVQRSEEYIKNLYDGGNFKNNNIWGNITPAARRPTDSELRYPISQKQQTTHFSIKFTERAIQIKPIPLLTTTNSKPIDLRLTLCLSKTPGIRRSLSAITPQLDGRALSEWSLSLPQLRRREWRRNCFGFIGRTQDHSMLIVILA